jgi:glycosyltransferase involved in cell wall biosynthesis
MQYLRHLDRPFEILLIDDGSTDETATLAQKLTERNSEIIFIPAPVAHGFGACLRAALARAKYPLFFYTALDYPYAPHELRKLLDRIDDVDLVSGYRSAQPLPTWARVTETIVNLTARILIGLQRDKLAGWLGAKAHWYSWFVSIIFGVHIIDVDSAFKLFRREIFARIPIQSNGVLVHTEIIAKANFITCWMEEIPIGALSGANAESLKLGFSWREHFRGMRRLFSRPDFGPVVPVTH